MSHFPDLLTYGQTADPHPCYSQQAINQRDLQVSVVGCRGFWVHLLEPPNWVIGSSIFSVLRSLILMGVVAFPPSSSGEGFFFPKHLPEFAVICFLNVSCSGVDELDSWCSSTCISRWLRMLTTIFKNTYWPVVFLLLRATLRPVTDLLIGSGFSRCLFFAVYIF